MCGVIHEDTMHSLVWCDFSHSIWAQSNLPLPNITTNIFHDWFSAILNVLDTNRIMHAVAILYHIWRARNGAVWDACLPLPRKILVMATATLHAWRKVHDVMPNAPLATASSGEGPPSASTAGLPPIAASNNAAAMQHQKCYVNAGYRHATNSATVGVILLDVNGGYISAYSAPLPNCFSPLMAEAFVAKEALSWLHARGEHSVRLYTDCHALQCYLSSSDDPPRFILVMLLIVAKLISRHFMPAQFFLFLDRRII
ncbi:PREDICTED: uncharacterized protein LOC109154685 [Ipomoea nil]|uniref:uncharacterized protein LOC109154685 n=1 Tax=Ipomoea nil TaxID=35883 RepID=UPI000901F5EE|nr:PREDICTED: uncharacterized protein LOC109154685 [Ipomoea nil]